MWKYIAELKDDPVAVVLSRQKLPTLDRNKYASAANVKRGGYIIAGAAMHPDVILMATGSEVSLMLEAHEKLASEGVKVRSVSMPCVELFKHQPCEYREMVLPNSCRARVSIEAATNDTWGAFIGLDGEHVGMITFGLSAPVQRLHQELGFTIEAVTSAARRVMEKQPRTMTSQADVMRAWKRRKVGSNENI